MNKVARGNVQTLCYWVASKPGRQMNFIRLWDVEMIDTDTSQTFELLEDLLEMLFALAFQSLPRPTLERFLGFQDFSLRGLNVVSPLLQSIALSETERSEARQWLMMSESSESREFSDSRSKARRRQGNSTLRPSARIPKHREIEGAFDDAISAFSPSWSAINEPVIESSKGSHDESERPTVRTAREENVSKYLQERKIMKHLWAFPFGSMDARIGMILDFDICSFDDKEAGDSQRFFPKVLETIGFRETNCLIWTFNFQVPYTPRRFASAGITDQALEGINRQIIKTSQTRVIILYGLNAEKMAIVSDFPKTKLTIGQTSFDMFLQIEKDILLRIYLSTSTPLSMLSSSNWSMSMRVAIAIRVATVLTNTPGIRPLRFRSQAALSEIVVARIREQT